MNIAQLKSLDARTAAGLLASAALLHEAPFHAGEGSVGEADELITDIRSKLRIAPQDTSARATRLVDEFLAREIANRLVQGADPSKLLRNAGQAGRLPPSFYQVLQPSAMKFFYELGIRPNHIEDAVRHPDDYQHLLGEQATEENKNAVSLFMKEIRSRDPIKSHWLLVQTHRQGIFQTAQSAWRVYPDDIDLTGASEPVDVMRAFAGKYGVPFRVNGVGYVFLALEKFNKGDQIILDFPNRDGIFSSFSKVDTIAVNVLNGGMGYCIDTIPYRLMLIKRGLKDVMLRPVLPQLLGTQRWVLTA